MPNSLLLSPVQNSGARSKAAIPTPRPARMPATAVPTVHPAKSPLDVAVTAAPVSVSSTASVAPTIPPSRAGSVWM